MSNGILAALDKATQATSKSPATLGDISIFKVPLDWQEHMLSKEERERKLHEVQAWTMQEIREHLQNTGRCAVIRPTGFGKTYIMCKTAAEYAHPLYIAPLDIIKRDAKHLIKEHGCTDGRVMGYDEFAARMLESPEKKFLKMISNRDILILDEYHCAGTEKRMNAIKRFQELYPEVPTLGGTATPHRADGTDVSYEVFMNTFTSEYTLGDAFKDGLLLPPMYITSSLISPEEYIADIKRVVREDVSSMLPSEQMGDFDTLLKSMSVDLTRVLNLPSILQRNLGKIHKELPRYTKFIVFCPSISRLRKRMPEICEAVSKAFPGRVVAGREITSVTSKAGMEAFFRMPEEDGKIDVIFTVDKLTMGLHTRHVACIMMLRETHSLTVWSQQVGRGLSVNAEYPCCMLDLLDNIKAEPYAMGPRREQQLVEECLDSQARARRKYTRRKPMEIDQCPVVYGEDTIESVDTILLRPFARLTAKKVLLAKKLLLLKATVETIAHKARLDTQSIAMIAKSCDLPAMWEDMHRARGIENIPEFPEILADRIRAI